jgi:small-conductance mechanosensitive channel
MKARWFFKAATIVMMVWLILLVPACAPAALTPTPQPTETPPFSPTSASTAESSSSPQPTEASDAAAGMSTAAAARTPIPTSTPGPVERGVEEIAERSGLSGETFLGLPVSYWVDLIVAALIIVAGYLVTSLLVDQILTRIVKRTKTTLDDDFLNEVNGKLRWLVILIITQYAISRISFLSDDLRTDLNDLLFVAKLVILTAMAFGLNKTVANHYKSTQATQNDQKRLAPIITVVQRFADFVVLLFALGLVLGHFGANSNTLYLILLITGVIASLAARDVIADALGGFIILSDQPFREGDRLHILNMDTWGDVLEIGTRTTRIRLVDNRELIVPNSQVAKSEIVNYNYPDTKYRLQTDVGVAYGIDMDHVRKTAAEAARKVKGVLEDEPLDVLFIEFDDSSRKVRVRWWIATFYDKWYALDRMNGALEAAFEKAHIDVAYETFDLRVRMEDGGDLVSRPKPSASQEDQKDNQS